MVIPGLSLYIKFGSDSSGGHVDKWMTILRVEVNQDHFQETDVDFGHSVMMSGTVFIPNILEPAKDVVN